MKLCYHGIEHCTGLSINATLNSLNLHNLGILSLRYMAASQFVTLDCTVYGRFTFWNFRLYGIWPLHNLGL